MRASPIVLSACLLISTTAGASIQTLTAASPNGRGKTALALEVGGATFPHGHGGMLTAGDLALSYGLSERDDLTARFGPVSGFELGLKRAFHFKSVPQLALAMDGRAGLRFDITSEVPLLSANVGVLAEWSPLRTVHLLASPRLLLSNSATAAWTAPFHPESSDSTYLQSINTEAALIPAATFGVGVDVQPSLRLVAETGFIFAPVYQSWTDQTAPLHPLGALRGISAAFAIQWRPESL